MSATATSAAGPVLLFSIATNGYEKHFAALLEKQRAFAAAIGAHYWVAQGRPPWGISAHDSVWMKIPLIVQALRRGYAWVLYLDADCEVLDCPSPVATFAGGRESIFVCRDFSGRINSAVIFVRNTPEAQRVFRRLWRSSFRPAGALPPEDRNLYENGHVIHYLKHEPAVRVIENRWNCSIFREVAEPFIFHHGGTPVRAAQPAPPRPRWSRLRGKIAAATTGFRLPWHAAFYFRQLPRPEGGRG